MQDSFESIMEQHLGHGQRVSFKEFEYYCVIFLVVGCKFLVLICWVTNQLAIYKDIQSAPKDKVFFGEFKSIIENILASDSSKK
jgi:hypothetical protein